MSDGAKLSGQQFNQDRNFVLPFTEQMLDYSGPDSLRVTGAEGQAATEVTPTDRASAKARVWDVAGIAAAIAAATPIIWTSYVNLDLPDVLDAVVVTFNKSSGAGVSNHPATQQFAEAHDGGTASIHPNASAQASAAIMPDVQPQRTSVWARNIPATNYAFYMVSPVTPAALLTKLTELVGTDVNILPVFKPKWHYLTAKGQQVSIRADADTAVSLGGTPGSESRSYAFGNGSSKEVGVTVRSVEIPPTIHGTLTVQSTDTPPISSDTAGVSVSVEASTPGATMNGSEIISPIANAPATTTGTASGSVSPTTLLATSPTAIPTSGIYLVDLNPRPDIFTAVFVHAVVVDFSVFA